jgi:DNA repair exonuclease SbcCD ATPase subunit
MSRQDNLKNLIAAHQRQLQKLKEQQAAMGLHTPPYILTEIEDRTAELEQLQQELQELQQQAAAPAQPTTPPAAGGDARTDWGDAPDVSVFFGRAAELAELEQWLSRDR